jgi:hypothetical protein
VQDVLPRFGEGRHHSGHSFPIRKHDLLGTRGSCFLLTSATTWVRGIVHLGNRSGLVACELDLAADGTLVFRPYYAKRNRLPKPKITPIPL